MITNVKINLPSAKPQSGLLLYIAMLFLIGLGYIAITPVYEGFDETAHFSSVKQIADTGTFPEYGKSFLSKDVAEYQGPVPFGSLEPPFDVGMVYSKFFADSALGESYIKTYRQTGEAHPFEPSKTSNWQAQHPFLYYAILSPMLKLTEAMPLVTQVFALRLGSYLFAIGGVVFGFLAFRNKEQPLLRDPAALGFLLYPIVFPMFFPEFARIGNDSLCLFLTGLVAYLFAQHLKNPEDKKLPFAIGAVLGLGLLTKAFFIPVTIALCGFLFLSSFLRKKQNGTAEWRAGLVTALSALLIGGGWYVYKWLVYGDIIGGNDAIDLAQHGGFFENFRKNFSIFALARGLVVTFVSWSWAGTWSLARPSALLHLPLLGLTLIAIIGFALHIRKQKLSDPAWLPVWLFGIFAVGLVHHIVISLAINGNGNTPGYYLHILMPWAAPAIGVGITALMNDKRLRIPLIGMLGYAVLFHIMVLWSQFALYTGCAVKNDEKLYAFSGHAFCLDQIPTLFERLSVIGWPVFALIGFCGGAVCALLMLKASCKNS